jgi:hypothetical protein
VNYIFSGTIQENAKRMNYRRLQKTPELNQSGIQEIKHLEGTRGPHAKAEPNPGPAQADRAPLAPIKPYFEKVPPPPLRVNPNHSFRSVLSYGDRLYLLAI